MASRTKNQYLGDMGEVGLLQKFLELGASVNSLSASDFGWDLHLHLPEVPMNPNTMPKKWAMSGYTANVQVKNRTSKALPKAKLGTVRGWVTGSKAGTPTFVFICRRGALEILDPRGLEDLLYRSKNCGLDDDATITLEDARPAASDHLLASLLVLWCRYPGIMMIGDISDLSATPKEVPNAAAQFVAGMVAAFLKAHLPGSASKDGYDYYHHLEEFVAVAAHELYPGDDDKYEEMRISVNGAHDLRTFHGQTGQEWGEVSYAQCYATSTNRDTARTEALDAVRQASRFLQACMK